MRDDELMEGIEAGLERHGLMSEGATESPLYDMAADQIAEYAMKAISQTMADEHHEKPVRLNPKQLVAVKTGMREAAMRIMKKNKVFFVPEKSSNEV